MNDEALLHFFISEGTKWVLEQRDKHRSQGRSPAEPHREHLAGFFPRTLVDSIVLNIVPEIENPGFYSVLDTQGIPRPLDFRLMAGITFVDTVCISASRVSDSLADRWALIFHECVHAVQYYLLGVEEFMRLYVLGWAANGRSYERIPLEEQAYELEARYRSSGGRAFSVLPVVREQLGLAT
ncbi:MAG: hypothetical protein ACRD2L_09835 [Terriglobia bacterium]